MERGRKAIKVLGVKQPFPILDGERLFISLNIIMTTFYLLQCSFKQERKSPSFATSIMTLKHC